jgi:hypothetical protein
MEDKSLFSSSQPQTISEGLQNFIDAMVEEIVLEGKPFDTQKKYLKKFSENEGLDYEAIEKAITELVETLNEMKSTDSKSLMKLALIQAKEACVTEEAVVRIAGQIGKNVNEPQSAKQVALGEIVQNLQNQQEKVETREPNDDFKSKLAKYEYVDLGLPSGTLWATFNVGATKPEEFGDYFAWGETAPKTTYNWETYKHCNGSPDQLTKYCDKSKRGYKGFTDKLFVLQPSDDAATVNWGKEWRTPLIEEWGELQENTSYMWTTLNGVKGCLFTARNGNTLFLPAAGNREGMKRYDDLGRYWSSTLDYYYRNFRTSSHFLGFSPNGCAIGLISYRSYGFSVRPVWSGTGIAVRQIPKGGLRGFLSSILEK